MRPGGAYQFKPKMARGPTFLSLKRYTFSRNLNVDRRFQMVHFNALLPIHTYANLQNFIQFVFILTSLCVFLLTCTSHCILDKMPLEKSRRNFNFVVHFSGRGIQLHQFITQKWYILNILIPTKILPQYFKCLARYFIQDKITCLKSCRNFYFDLL